MSLLWTVDEDEAEDVAVEVPVTAPLAILSGDGAPYPLVAALSAELHNGSRPPVVATSSQSNSEVVTSGELNAGATSSTSTPSSTLPPAMLLNDTVRLSTFDLPSYDLCSRTYLRRRSSRREQVLPFLGTTLLGYTMVDRWLIILRIHFSDCNDLNTVPPPTAVSQKKRKNSSSESSKPSKRMKGIDGL
jgi:hypothetical protein